MPVRITQKLVCKLTKDEIDERGRKASELDQERRHLADEKKAKVKVFNAQLKGLDTQIAELTEAATKGEELRDVECEERPSLVEGSNVVEIWRLDTNELLETIAEDPEDDAPESERRQGALPFAAPKVPELRCTGINADGECFSLTAEQADAASREIELTKSAVVFVNGGDNRQTIVKTIVKVLRGKACGTCGIVAPHHRPECKAIEREMRGKVLVVTVDGEDLEVDTAIGDEVREANRTGIACEYIDVVNGESRTVDLAMVKGEPVFGVDEDGGKHELTPAEVKGLRDAIREITTLEIEREEGSFDLVKFAGMGEDEGDDFPDGKTIGEIADECRDALADEPAPDSYDRNDTSQVAAKIREVAPPNDKPLAPKRGVDTATAKPKRKAKGAKASAESEAE